jgi:hypothetical protein
VFPVIDGNGPNTKLLREFCLSKAEALLSDVVAKRLWRLGEPLSGFPVRGIRDTGHFDVARLERQEKIDVFKM